MDDESERDRTPSKEMVDMADDPALKMVTEKEKKASILKEIKKLGGRASSELSISKLRTIRNEIKLEVARLKNERRSRLSPRYTATEEYARELQKEEDYNKNKGGYVKKYAHGGSVRKTKLSDY